MRGRVRIHRAEPVAGNAKMHADRGSQYHSRTHRNALRRHETRQSTSRTGFCPDGATADPFFVTLKATVLSCAKVRDPHPARSRSFARTRERSIFC
jgi:putative transposase